MVALAVYVGLLALLRVPVQPLQVPGYLLVLGFDALQNPLAPGLGGGAFVVALAAYLLGLAAVAGWLAGRLRRRFGPAGPLRYGVAGAALAFAGVTLLVLLATFVPHFAGNWTPLLVAAATALASLWVGWRLAGARPVPAEG